MLFERIHLDIKDADHLLQWVSLFEGADQGARWSFFEHTVNTGQALISMNAGEGHKQLLAMCRSVREAGTRSAAAIGEDDDSAPQASAQAPGPAAMRRLSLLREGAETWLWTSAPHGDHYDPAKPDFIERLKRGTGMYVTAGTALRAALEPALRAATTIEYYDPYVYSISNRKALYSLIAWVRGALPEIEQLDIVGFIGQLPGTDKEFKVTRESNVPRFDSASKAAGFFKQDLEKLRTDPPHGDARGDLMVRGTIIDVSVAPPAPDPLRFRVHDRMLCLLRNGKRHVIAIGYGTYAFSGIDQPDAPDAPIHTTLARLPAEAMATLSKQYGINEIGESEVHAATWQVSLPRPLSPKAAPPSSS
jgi:hypothetical protein